MKSWTYRGCFLISLIRRKDFKSEEKKGLSAEKLVPGVLFFGYLLLFKMNPSVRESVTMIFIPSVFAVF